MFYSYPDLYNVLVLTNPLVDLAALSSNSDVPDLAWQLLGLNYTVKSLPSDVVNVAWEKYCNFLKLSILLFWNKVIWNTIELVLKYR